MQNYYNIVKFDDIIFNFLLLSSIVIFVILLLFIFVLLSIFLNLFLKFNETNNNKKK